MANIPTLSPSAPRGPAADVSPALEAALARLGPARSLLVVVNDPQRHTDTRPILEALAHRLDLARVRVLVAAGSHSFGQKDREAFEHRLADGLPFAGLAWHECRSGSLAEIGEETRRHGQDAQATHGQDARATWRGHPWLLEAEAILAVGSVEPHYFAGFTGAHKTVTIGCAAYANIEANHSFAAEPACRPCRLDGNPVFAGVRDMLAALERQRPVAAVNVVQAGPRVLRATGGGAMESVLSAVPTAIETFCRRIDSPADAIIAEVSGPLGVSFYQADKGLKNSEWALRRGGVLVLQAPCPAGIGQDQFMRLLREAPTHARAVEIVNRRGYRLGDHKAIRLRYLTDERCRAVRLFLVCEGISPEDARALGATKAQSAEQAMRLAGIRPGRDSVYRVQDAGNVCVLTGA